MAQTSDDKRSLWELLGQNTVIVPIIQRDYAQGRETKRAKRIRRSFLDSLATALKERRSLCLDFVYGAKVGEQEVELIDGQQRLTTLFLLHLYYAAKDGRAGDPDVERAFSRFRYECRGSSREFCENLLQICRRLTLDNVCVPAPEEKGKDKPEDIPFARLSAQIKNSTLFSDGWEFDPTVCGMLHMLDTINNHPYFGATEGLFDTLTTDKCVVFEFLNIEQFSDSEDLYVKMNARGKPLTDFENFKAMFGKRLTEREPAAAKRYWDNIDGDWSRAFWAYISARYKEQVVEEKQRAYRIDFTALQYLWQQVMMISCVLNEHLNIKKNELLFPEFFQNDGTPQFDFGLIDRSASSAESAWEDWNGKTIGGMTPEVFLVESLACATDVLRLTEELFGVGGKVTLWKDSSVCAALYPVENKDGQSLSSKQPDYFERILGFALTYWCCVFGVPAENSAEKERMIGYLRMIRHAVVKNRSKKSGKWNSELGKDNIGQVTAKAISLLDNTVEWHETLRVSKYPKHYEEERWKVDQIAKMTDDQIEVMRGFEDLSVCKGAVKALFEDGKPLLDLPHFAELMRELPTLGIDLSCALLACGSKDAYFRIPAGEGNNFDRLKFGSNDESAWSLGLQYDEDNFTVDWNRDTWKELMAKYGRALATGKTPAQALGEMCEAFLDEISGVGTYDDWRYYFVRYKEAFFAAKTVVFNGREQTMPAFPLMDFEADHPFACQSTYKKRFRKDSSVNSFLLAAAWEYFGGDQAAFLSGFSVGEVCRVDKGDRIVEMTFSGGKFKVGSETVRTDDIFIDVVDALKNAIENA